MSRHHVEVVDKQAAQPVDALLFDDITAWRIREIEEEWGPIRRDAARRVAENLGPHAVPEHWHWDWTRKAPKLQLLAYRCLSIEADGKAQGLMMLNTVSHVARLDPDKGRPMVYVDYLESAPWNVKGMVAEPRFGAIGSRLFEAAIRLSIQEGFRGRVGLHSLPQSEDFYERVCRMVRLERDIHVQNLYYFELTAEAANAFLTGRKRQ